MSRLKAMKSAVKHTLPFPIFMRRRFHAYCLGAPKTGTSSIAEMLKGRYRSEHEPLVAGTIDHVLAAHRGTINSTVLYDYLMWRDRELYLELESSHPMTVFAGALARLFPTAKFILCVRHPRSWLDSIINMRLNRAVHRFEPTSPTPQGQFFRELNEIYYRDAFPVHSPEERVLEERGLFTLEGYLSGWAEHYRTVLDQVPADRLLVMPTAELSSHPERLASFLDIPLDTINHRKSHSHTAPEKHNVLELLNDDWIENRIELHCGDTLRELQARVAS